MPPQTLTRARRRDGLTPGNVATKQHRRGAWGTWPLRSTRGVGTESHASMGPWDTSRIPFDSGPSLCRETGHIRSAAGCSGVALGHEGPRRRGGVDSLSSHQLGEEPREDRLLGPRQGGAAGQLAGLIIRRSQVRILPLLLIAEVHAVARRRVIQVQSHPTLGSAGRRGARPDDLAVGGCTERDPCGLSVALGRPMDRHGMELAGDGQNAALSTGDDAKAARPTRTHRRRSKRLPGHHFHAGVRP